jgi:hypothetical protein
VENKYKHTLDVNILDSRFYRNINNNTIGDKIADIGYGVVSFAALSNG